MLKRYSIWVFVAAVVIIPITVFAVMNWYERKFEHLPVLNQKDQTISDFKMVNQNGSTITLENWKNKIVIVDFFFSHCASVCPKMTANLKQVHQAYKNDDEVLINSFTVDPERDSAAQLKMYADEFGVDGDKWNFLTGPKTEIYKLARKSFSVVATDGDGGPNDFIHSDKLVLLDKQKRIRGYYDGTSAEEVNQLINDIKKLKDEN